MDKSKRFNITLDPRIASELEYLVAQRRYPSISFAIESLVRKSLPPDPYEDEMWKDMMPAEEPVRGKSQEG